MRSLPARHTDLPLQIYMAAAAPEQFGSVRLVAVGAEKLPNASPRRLRNTGIRPFEAHGCTECSPA